MKKVNRYTSNEFHDWQRRNLPKHFVIQDLDTWVVCISDSEKNFEPLCLVELKRSHIEPQRWKPFSNDLPNYIALKKLADRARLPLVVLYFRKDKVIDDGTDIALFRICHADKGSGLKYQCKIIKASELRDQFPRSILDF